MVALAIFRPEIEDATLAQLVEQRTENPCVPSSILGGGIFLLTSFLSIRTPNYQKFSIVYYWVSDIFNMTTLLCGLYEAFDKLRCLDSS